MGWPDCYLLNRQQLRTSSAKQATGDPERSPVHDEGDHRSGRLRVEPPGMRMNGSTKLSPVRRRANLRLSTRRKDGHRDDRHNEDDDAEDLDHRFGNCRTTTQKYQRNTVQDPLRSGLANSLENCQGAFPRTPRGRRGRRLSVAIGVVRRTAERVSQESSGRWCVTAAGSSATASGPSSTSTFGGSAGL